MNTDWGYGFFPWLFKKSVEASSLKEGTVTMYTINLFSSKKVTIPSNKETGYYDGETDVTQDLKSD